MDSNDFIEFEFDKVSINNNSGLETIHINGDWLECISLFDKKQIDFGGKIKEWKMDKYSPSSIKLPNTCNGEQKETSKKDIEKWIDFFDEKSKGKLSKQLCGAALGLDWDHKFESGYILHDSKDGHYEIYKNFWWSVNNGILKLDTVRVKIKIYYTDDNSLFPLLYKSISKEYCNQHLNEYTNKHLILALYLTRKQLNKVIKGVSSEIIDFIEKEITKMKKEQSLPSVIDNSIHVIVKGDVNGVMNNAPVTESPQTNAPIINEKSGKFIATTVISIVVTVIGGGILWAFGWN